MTSCPAIQARASGPSTSGGSASASRENSLSSSILPAAGSANDASAVPPADAMNLRLLILLHSDA